MERTVLHPGVGTELAGLEAAQLDAAAGAELRRLLADEPLVVLREQDLDAVGLIAFTRRLGEPLVHPPHPAYPDQPEIAPMSNEPAKGRQALPYWHTDGLLRPDPPALTVFYAVEVPEHGGDTLFINAYEAFEALDEEDRRTLEGLTAVFPTGTEFPVVRAHPVSGRKGLNANLAATVGLVGVERSSAERLYLQLRDYIDDPERIYRHSYRRGDLLVWDNIGVMHSASDPPPPGEARLMLRTDVAFR